MKKKRIKWDRVALVASLVLLSLCYMYGQSLTREINDLNREIIILKQNLPQ